MNGLDKWQIVLKNIIFGILSIYALVFVVILHVITSWR